MFQDHNGIIHDLVERSGKVSGEQLEGVRTQQREGGQSVAEILLTTGLLDPASLFTLIGEELGLAVELSPPMRLDAKAIALLPGRLAHRYQVAPLELRGDSLRLLVADPFNHHVVDDLNFTLKRPVEAVVVDPRHVQALIREAYGSNEVESIDEVVAAFEASRATAVTGKLGVEALGDMASEAPVIRLVDLILAQAIRDGASDIHFEPFEEVFQVRYRIAGALYEMAPPPHHLALPVISRIKVLADLDIAEQRVPQDGRIKLNIEGRAVDLRVSTLPTEFGESVVLRVLDKSVVNLDLDQLGIPADVLAGIREVARRPNGIFIVTGPTGSGKTTTLYSALREVNDVETKILTAEDPVEYEIDGLIQTPINPGVGLTFASALRSFLRQDPDKILVGEIRDLETARIAVQASLTGHLVLTTLHTNDAPGAVTRLLDMGVEPFLISASLEAILAQRLVRAICPSCKTAFQPESGVAESLGLSVEELASRVCYYGRGCAECHQTGYRGRLGLFEWMPIDDHLRQLITNHVPTPKLRQASVAKGMRTLREDGQRLIFEGRTTIQEVMTYT
jgi:type IV pilus assembly protein PilB